MNPADIVLASYRAIEQGDWPALQSLLTDDFLFSGATPVPLRKAEVVASMKALWAAFPDVQFNPRIVQVQGNRVHTTIRITGTHTGLLIPPLPGVFLTIQPTGKKVALVEEPSEYTLRGDKIITLQAVPNPDGGWPGILKQLGVDYHPPAAPK